MFLPMEILAVAGEFPTYFVAVYVVGFIAAVTIGSIAWYNSKRPVGWEDSSKPDYVPDLKTENNPKVQK
ncbi:MAG: photosystem II assembly protein Psb35 [Xenococcaceae cyanobacterium]